jgi:hypothetical protein
MSTRDEFRTCSLLIVSFIRKIDYGRDLEAQLNMYVDCRQAFARLDSVAEELVLRVILLCNKAYNFMKGRHTRKTASFAKACFAYCHITIPSLDDIFTRLRLFLNCGQVALVNGMIVQSEGFLRASILMIPEVPGTLENANGAVVTTVPQMESYVLNFTAFLLMFPGHPTRGPFYLLQGLLNSVSRYQPWSAACASKARVFMGILSLLAAYGQRNFLFTIPRVESNDALYAQDQTYTKALGALLDGVIKAIFEQVRDIGGDGKNQDVLTKKTQCSLALEFMNILISSLTMNKQTATVVVTLYTLSKQSNLVDSYRVATKRHVQNKRGVWYQDIFQAIDKLDT